MPLTMCPTGLGHGAYKDDVDYSVYCGEWCIGRIYETRTGPESLRWFWALHFPAKPPGLRTDNRAATLDAATKPAKLASVDKTACGADDVPHRDSPETAS
jgi:hypothetical protein